MQLSTTSTLEGATISHYCGLVSGEAILDVNFSQNALLGLINFLRRRSNSYTDRLKQSRDAAIKAMQEQAIALQADAVVGIQIHYQGMGGDKGMMLITVLGTAVRLTPRG